MAKTISKTLMVTCVKYKTVEVQNGNASFVDHPDAIFSGLLEQDKVERLLRAQLGKDAMIVVTSVDAGQHRYEMDLETFVLNARIADDEPAGAADDDPIADSGPTSDDASADPADSSVPAPEDPASASGTVPVPQADCGTNGQPLSEMGDGDDDVEI